MSIFKNIFNQNKNNNIDEKISVCDSKFKDQINRIREKLTKAKKVDKDLKVFGASSHKYLVNQNVSKKDIEKFENKYEIKLPKSYTDFILNIGDNKSTKSNSIAGPFYGLYTFNSCEEYINKNALKNPCILKPKMSDDEWDKIIEKAMSNDISDEDYENQLDKIFGGMLPIGTQGCTYYHYLILNGDYAGKIVNIDEDFQKPKFTFEENFLDWYERWLDEIISGQLLQEGPNWFGYCRGESPEDLISIYKNSSDFEEKQDCINALYTKKVPMPDEVLDEIENLIKQKKDIVNFTGLLIKSSYDRAIPYLKLIADTDINSLSKFIWWYAKDKANDWVDIIKSKIVGIEDDESFRFATYVLTSSDDDFGDFILQFTKNPNYDIKLQAFYTLSKAKEKQRYLDTFIQGLQDENPNVVRTALQALNGIKDERLLPYYKELVKKYDNKNDEDYIIVNVNHRLKEYGLDSKSIFNI